MVNHGKGRKRETSGAEIVEKDSGLLEKGAEK